MILLGAHDIQWMSVLRGPEWNGDGADVHPIDESGKRMEISVNVYGDNANIIPDEIPVLLEFMDEVLPEKKDEGA